MDANAEGGELTPPMSAQPFFSSAMPLSGVEGELPQRIRRPSSRALDFVAGESEDEAVEEVLSHKVPARRRGSSSY